MADATSSGNRAVWRPEEVPSSDSVVRAVVVAVLLGLLGPVLALVLSIPVVVLSLAVPMPVEVYVVLALITGQYLAFGGLALVYLRYRGLDWGGVRSYLGVDLPGVRDLLTLVGGFVFMWIALFGAFVLVQALGAPTAENTTAQQAEDLPQLIPLLFVAMFLVVGPCEEILYRGVVQGRLRESLPAIPSILIASAVFASIHFLALTGGVSGRLTTIAILFVPSLAFGAVYEITENLVVPALLHSIHNGVLMALLWVVVTYGEDLQATVLPAVVGGLRV